MGAGISVLSFLLGISLSEWILVISVQFFIALGYVFMNESFNMAYYQYFYSNNNLLGNVISTINAPVYFILTTGLYALYNLELAASAFLDGTITMPLIAVVAFLTVLFQMTYVFKLGIRAWNKMEF